MKSAKNPLKMQMILSLISEIIPVLRNETRWSGKINMIGRFVKIRTNLIAAATDVESGIEVEDRLEFCAPAGNVIQSWKQ